MKFLKDKVSLGIMLVLMLVLSFDVYLKKAKAENISALAKTTKVMPRPTILPIMPPIVIEVPKDKGKT